MGTVNYSTSEYITLGIRPYDRLEFEKDDEFMDEARREVDEYGGTLEEAIDRYIEGCYEADYANAKYLLDKHKFTYFHIVIEPGYYEGFTIDIERNCPVAYDTWEDKRDAQKEITEIKQLLIDCAGCGFVACRPGWCTFYSDYKGTIAAIEGAVRAMREDVRLTPTWSQYEKGGEAYGH